MGIPIFTDCSDKGAKIGNFRESKDADYKSAGSLRSDCKSDRTRIFRERGDYDYISDISNWSDYSKSLNDV